MFLKMQFVTHKSKNKAFCSLIYSECCPQWWTCEEYRRDTSKYLTSPKSLRDKVWTAEREITGVRAGSPIPLRTVAQHLDSGPLVFQPFQCDFSGCDFLCSSLGPLWNCPCLCDVIFNRGQHQHSANMTFNKDFSFFPSSGRITLMWDNLRPSTDRCCLLGVLGVASATNAPNREETNDEQRCSRHLASPALAPRFDIWWRRETFLHDFYR